jgi:hypothetical protein
MKCPANAIRLPSSLVATILALLLTAVASPAMAYVAVVTTSVPVTSADDEAQLRTALESAVDDVLARAIAFTPTFVALENVRVVGDRIYLLFVIADADGEKSMQAFSSLETPAEEPAAPSRKATPRFTY